MAASMASSSVLYFLLGMLAVVTASPALLDKNTEVLFGEHELDILRLLPDGLLHKLMSRVGDDDEYTKLERMLVNAVLSFGDKMSAPQPALGLPALDPFVFTTGKKIQLSSDFINLDATLVSVFSQGVSKFKVAKLGLFLVERLGVLDLTLPALTAECTLDVAAGSWVSPLKVPVVDRLNIKFSSSEIRLGLRGKVSVKNSRLSMESTKIDLDLGDWKLEIVSENPAGTMQQNVGLSSVIVGLVKSLAPRVMEDWTPVAEKYVNVRLDEKLQDLQLSDIINQLDTET